MNLISNDLNARVIALAVERAASLFPFAGTLSHPPGDGAFVDKIIPFPQRNLSSILRGPMLGRDLHEGILIEDALALALGASETSVDQRRPIKVTEHDLALVKSNVVSRLVKVRPPAAGQRGRKFEIDIVAHHAGESRFTCIDVKRTMRSAKFERKHRLKCEAAAVAARRFYESGELQIDKMRVLTVRWSTDGRAAGNDIVCPEAINDALEAPVRATVDLAIETYSAEFERLLEALMERRIASRVVASPPKPQRAASPEIAAASSEIAPAAAPIGLHEAWKLAMRARRS